MKDFYLNTIRNDKTIENALEKLNNGALKQTLFVVDDNDCLIGTLTDGDIRRALLAGSGISTPIKESVNTECYYLNVNSFTPENYLKFKELKLKIIPLVQEESKKIIRLIQVDEYDNFLPIQAVIMAGGKGMRLRPLTNSTPKPMLKIGQKPIIEHNIDRLVKFGIQSFNISLNYLGEKISGYFKDGAEKFVNIEYTNETEPLGTIGSLKLVEKITSDSILVMNSDLLTNIDYGEFYNQFLEDGSDMMIATTSYKIKVPYAVLQTNGNEVLSFIEKPTLNYPTNAGIYLIKKSALDFIPSGEIFNATDLIDTLISNQKKVTHFPILGYWLDIGKPQDFEKAQEDIQHLKI